MVFSIAPPISAHLRTQGCTLHDIGTISVTRFGLQVVKPSHLCSVPENSGAQAISIAAVASYVELMQQLLSIEPSITYDLARSDHLNGKKLDFSLDSVLEIDRYLMFLHDRERELLHPFLLTTFWTIAVYVGEIIRRAALDNKYRWVTIGEDAVPAGHTTHARAGIGAIRGLRAKDGDLSMPSLAVARIVLRGSKVPSIGSYVRRAIGLHA